MVAINSSAGVQTLHARRVLIVDDNRDAADILAVLLSMWGYDCRVSYDGASALQTARDYRPDCLLLDIRMPLMNGYTVARRLREQLSLERVKLVALTVCSDEADARRIRESGFDYHLIKPVEANTLKKLLRMMD